MSPPFENETTALRWLREISSEGAEPGAFDRIVAPDCVIHGGFPGLAPGPSGGRRSHEIATRFVELYWDVLDVVASGDRVAVRAVARTVHKPGGTFFGIPGSGQQIDFAIVWWFRFDEGKIAEVWRTADDLARLNALGARIAPQPAEDDPQSSM